MSQGNSEGRKIALLIGVSQCHPHSGLQNLQCPKNGVEALSEVLKNPHIGGFDDVECLLDPTIAVMQSHIADLFAQCKRNDLVLLYFTGHGVVDPTSNTLFFPTQETCKHRNSPNLNLGLAVNSISGVREAMSKCYSQRKVIILDCCFSGAFVNGTRTMGDNVDIKAKLGGEGCAILMATTASGYAFEREGEALSVYTRHLVEGLKTGAAAPDNQELIRAGDISRYIRKKLESTGTDMRSGKRIDDDGDEIVIAVSPRGRYATRVLEYLKKGDGQLNPIRQATLKAYAETCGISPETAARIFKELSPTPPTDPTPPSPKLDEYAEMVRQAVGICHPNPLSEEISEQLRDFQEALGLRDDDVGPIHEELGARPFTQPDPVELKKLDQRDSQSRRNFPNWILLGLVFFFFIGMVQFLRACQSDTKPPEDNPPPSSSQPTPVDLVSAGDNNKLYGSRSHSHDYDGVVEPDIKKGIEFFKQGLYGDALKKFRGIRESAKGNVTQASPFKDPEILIFQQNSQARLNAKDKGTPIYTIAAAVPLSNNKKEPFNIGQQMLFGMAQAQAEAIKAGINLEVVIANDRNDSNTVQLLADYISQPIPGSDNVQRNIIAVIGDYASSVTCVALQTYSQKQLAVISPASTKVNMRDCEGKGNKDESKKVFFRTASSLKLEAGSLAAYINGEIKNDENPKVAIFYKPTDEDFSKNLSQLFVDDLNLLRGADKTKIKYEWIPLSDNKTEVEKKLKDGEFSAIAVFPDGRSGDDSAFESAKSIIELNHNNGKKPMVGSNPLYDANVASKDKKTNQLNAEGLMISVDWFHACKPNEAFISGFKDVTTGTPNRIVASSYEAVQVVVELLRKGNTTKQSILNALHDPDLQVKNGLFGDGTISFEDNGDRKEIKDRILVTPNSNGDGTFTPSAKFGCDRM